MDKGIVLSLVLAALFLGAIAWLVVYSRLHPHADAPKERQRPAGAPDAEGAGQRE